MEEVLVESAVGIEESGNMGGIGMKYCLYHVVKKKIREVSFGKKLNIQCCKMIAPYYSIWDLGSSHKKISKIGWFQQINLRCY